MDVPPDLRHAEAANDGAPAARARHARTSAAPANGPRLAELLGALSHALDLAEGQPPGHALRSCWIGQQLGRAIGLTTAQLRDLYYATLLKDAGSSANAARVGALFLADDIASKREHRHAGTGVPGQLRFVIRCTGAGAGLRARLGAIANAVQNGGEIQRELTERRCARGAQVARQLRFGDDVADAIQALGEHWDGSGQPQGLAGREIPLHARLASLAQAVEASHARSGAQATREAIARRSGRLFDPRLADTFAMLARDPAFWRQLACDDFDVLVPAMEPARQPQPADADELDDIATVFGQIVDAKSPWTAGHSTRVALIAEQLARRLGLDAPERRWLRRGALLHDIGKLGVSNRILDKAGPLTAAEHAALQRHPMLTEQILGRIASFGSLARIAGAHHERLDGSGYPRGLDARHIRRETRILTTADIFAELTADRPWRPAMSVPQALDRMRGGIGRTIAGDCFAALERSIDALGESSSFGGL